MKNHTKIYFKYFGLTKADFVNCEICEAPAVDIHHIDARGMGGDPNASKDVIENLMAVCRKCHEDYGDKIQHKELLRRIHYKKMNK